MAVTIGLLFLSGVGLGNRFWNRHLQRAVKAHVLDGGELLPFGLRPSRPGTVWRIPGQRGFVGLQSLSFSVGQEEDDHGRFDVVFLLGKDGDVESDSIYAVPHADPLVVRTETSVMVGSHPFGAESFLSFLGADRLVYANTRIPTVELLDLAGTVRKSFDVPVTPVPVSDAELRATIEEEQAEAFVRALEEGAPYMWPALTGLVVDDEERIWVGERSESAGDDWKWTAYTQEGSAVGSVRLPSNFKLRVVRDGRLVGVATDELDIPRVQVYRIEGGEESQGGAAPKQRGVTPVPKSSLLTKTIKESARRFAEETN